MVPLSSIADSNLEYKKKQNLVDVFSVLFRLWDIISAIASNIWYISADTVIAEDIAKCNRI